MAGARVGVDVGGTFTDVAVVVDGRVVTAKVPSTPADQSLGAMAGLAETSVSSLDVEFLAHGTTVATNALLERTGGRTALVTTEGFRDVIEIGRQNRPSLYDLTMSRPAPLVPRELRFTVRERMGPEGVLVPLDRASLDEAIRRLSEERAEAVAVCLLFAFLHPRHERQVGAAVREALPGVHVSLSSDVIPEFREFERFSTTVANAYLVPVLGGYLRQLARRTRDAQLPSPWVMQSSGGVIEIEEARERAAACVLSGPAAGVVGAAAIAPFEGDLLSFDMGGTSTDVSPILGGRVQTKTDSVLAGIPIRLPMADVHSVGAGGGSIAWVDDGGALRVGPRSAGAEPGPACYGRGGEDATVTDADLVLGYLDDGAKLGGEVELDTALAEEAVQRTGRQLGLDPVEAASGVVRVANEEMLRALRLVTIRRGLDPRQFALVAFGGAGPMHACALAEELGIPTIIVPRESGVLSALGLALSEVRRDSLTPHVSSLEEVAGDLERAYARMEREAQAALDTPRLGRYADLRYRGQSFELTVDAGDLSVLGESFHRAHEDRFGYRMEEQPVEVVGLRLVATGSAPSWDFAEGDAQGDPRRETRKANFRGTWVETPVLERRRMGRGSEVDGPAIVELSEATCVVAPGWRGAVNANGNLVLERA